MDIVKVYKNSKYYNIAINILKDKYDNKKRGEQYWKKRYQKSKLNYIGFLLKVESECVGFLGVIGNNKIIGLSVWYVDLKFRNYSLLFISQVFKNLKDNSIINSSPNPTALKIFKKLFAFKIENEFIGLPNRIFGFSNKNKIYLGEKINVCYNNKVSILELIYLTIKYRKLCLSLKKKSNELLFYKKINVLYKNIKYKFPLSFEGDIYE